MEPSIRSRRYWLLLGVVGVVGLLGAVTYRWHLQQRRALAQAEQRAVLAAGLSLLQASDPRRALPWLLRAYQAAPHELAIRHHLAQALAAAEAEPLELPVADVSSGAFCGDGSRVVLGHSDGRTTLWEAASGRLVAAFDSSLGEVESVVCSPDGKSVVAQRHRLSDTSAGSSWLIWDVASGKQKSPPLNAFAEGHIQFTPDSSSLFGYSASWEEGGAKSASLSLYAVASGGRVHEFKTDLLADLGQLSHDGTRVLAAQLSSHEGEEESDYGVRVLDAASGKLLHKFELDAGCTDVQWLPGDRQILTLCGGNLELHDSQGGAPGKSLKLDRVTVKQVVIARDSLVLAALDDLGLVLLIDATSGKQGAVLGTRELPIVTMQLDRTGRRLLTSSLGPRLSSTGADVAVGNRRKLLQLWDLKTGRQLQTFSDRPTGIRSVELSPSGEQLLLIGNDRRAWLQPALSRQPGRVFLPSDPRERTFLDRAEWSPDRQLVLAVAGTHGRLIDAATGAEHAVLALNADFGESCCNSAAFLADGSTLATTVYSWAQSEDGQDWLVALWDGHSGKRLRELQAGRQALHSVALSADGRLVAAGAEDGTVLLWEAGSPMPSSLLKGHSGPVLSVAFSPDGQTLASGSVDGTVRLWAVGSRVLRRSVAVAAARVTQVGFGDQGRWLFAVSSDNAFRCFAVASGTRLRAIEGFPSNLLSVAVSADEKQVAILDGSQRVYLFALERGLLLRTLRLTTETLAVRFSADGAQLLTAEAQGSFATWDLGAESRPPPEVQGAVSSHPGWNTREPAPALSGN